MIFTMLAISLLTSNAAAFMGDLVPSCLDRSLDTNKAIIVLKETANRGKHAQWFSTTLQTSLASASFENNLLSDCSGVHYNWEIGTDFVAYSVTAPSDVLKALKIRKDVKIYDTLKPVYAFGTQLNAPNWGLGRISNANKGSKDYTYPDSAGSGVTAYVIDTGIQTNHPEFEGRASWGVSYVGETSDGQGHGTHCAGIIGSKTYGVAKKSKLVAVQVLSSSGSGTNEGVINGVNWVGTNGVVGKSVASMSLGGGASAALDAAIVALINKGIPVVVAAGNDAKDCCSSVSPAKVTQALTVASTDVNDVLSSFSNYGSCVDIAAPGSAILSTYKGSGTSSLSGTSMACPHVAGIVALALADQSFPDVAAVNAFIVKYGNPNKLSINKTPLINLLASNKFGPITPSTTTTTTATGTTAISTKPPPTTSTCAHSKCVTGVALAKGCDACVDKIIVADAYCGSTSWDSICVGQVKSVCGITC